jgi:hypothetical protein
MRFFENVDKLESCDQPTLVKLCRHHIDVIERLLNETQRVNAFMQQHAAAFTKIGVEHGNTMLMILDDIEKVGPGIVDATALPPKQ